MNPHAADWHRPPGPAPASRMAFRVAAFMAGFITVVMALFWPSWAAAQQPVERQWSDVMLPGRYWIDTTGKAGLSDVRVHFDAGDDRPYDPRVVLPLGDNAAAWFRIALPSTATARPVMFSVPHPGMDVVEFYRHEGADRWRVERSGDATPVYHWPVRDRIPAFEFVLQPGDPGVTQVVWLRVQHSHPIGIRWGLWDSHNFDETSKLWHLILGGYAGFILLVVVLSCFNAVSWRDPIHLYYAGYVMVLGLSQFSQTGIAGEFLWPRNAWWNDISSVILPVLAVASAILFVGELVAERGKRWLSWVNAVAIGTGAAIAVVFLIAGRAPVFALSNLYYLFCFVFYMGVVAWFAWRRPRVGLWILAGLLTIIVGGTFGVLRNMGILPLSFATQYGAQVGVALEIPLMLVGLYFRSRERRDSQVRLSALMRVDPLTGVGTHRVLMERLDHLMQRVKRDPMAGAVLRVRLGNEADIRQEFGAEVAQAAVVKAASIVARAATEGDTVARHRDGDFVMILEGRMSRDKVAEVGQNIIARGLGFSQKLPKTLTMQLRVACAAAPLPLDTDAESMLASLDVLLDDIQKNPGKAMRFLSDGNSGIGTGIR